MNEITFQVKCNGRNLRRWPVLEEAVDVRVRIYQHEGSNMISSEVSCVHIAGCHGERCDASGAERVTCPYAFDIPYALDNKNNKK